MSSVRKVKDWLLIPGVLGPLSLLLAGCQGNLFAEGGPEIRYLTSTPPPLKVAAAKPLLPLGIGTSWEMRLIGNPGAKEVKIEARITRSDSSGSVMEIRKGGQLWRREVYRSTKEGLFLTAMGEDNKPMMLLSPSVPVLLYPLSEGKASAWNGSFQYANLTYPATSFSRVSALETVSSPYGKKTAYRIDTHLQIDQEGTMVKFLAVRWLVPGVGFVRRSFVDQGRLVFVELRKFTPA